MYQLLLAVFLFCNTQTADSLYHYGDGTVQLTPTNFNANVIDSRNLWYVLFYSPACNYCKQIEPEYVSVARSLRGNVYFGVVNMEDHASDFDRLYKIEGFPTIYVFGSDKSAPKEYTAINTAKAFREDALQRLKLL
jgi:protein disulfide-isomerase A6